MIAWALFDSGNGSYTKAVNELNKELEEEIKIFPIGIDIEKKNNHFIELDLSDYKRMFGDNTLFNTLDELPKPDLIIASPPCESWSVASAMKNGNACWKQEKIEDNGFFSSTQELSRFTIRTQKDYDEDKKILKYDKQFMKRINGELCVFNTIEIIKRYNPKFFVIENPSSGRIWDYIEDVMGFKLAYKNPTRYNNYGYKISKPTKFASNIDLKLKNKLIKNEVNWNKFSKSYNERSNIPQELVIDIFKEVIKHNKEK